MKRLKGSIQFQREAHFLALLRNVSFLFLISIAFVIPKQAFAQDPQTLSDSALAEAAKTDTSLGIGLNEWLAKTALFRTMTPKTQKELTKAGIYFGGFYRQIVHYSALDAGFPTLMDQPNRLFLRDPFNEPIMEVFVGGNMGDDVRFNTQIRFINNFAGVGNYNEGDRIQLVFGLTFGMSAKTSFGNINLNLGGIQYAGLTPFLMGSGGQFNRYAAFERPNGAQPADLWPRYNNHFNYDPGKSFAGFGGRPFNGVQLRITEMPKQMEFQLLAGRTDANGGFNGFRQPNLPSQMLGARLIRRTKEGYYGLNTFNSYTAEQSVNGGLKGQNLHTIEYRHKMGPIQAYGEVGIGSYGSPTYVRRISEGLNMKFLFDPDITGIPVELQYYQMGVNFVNLNGAYSTITIPEAQQVNTNVLAAQTFNLGDSPIPGVGALANNRRGVNLNAAVNITENLKWNFGYGIASEIERIGKTVTLIHQIGGASFGKLNPGGGPYNRVISFFSGYFTRINILPNDSSDALPFRKHFQSVESQLKYKTKIAGRNLYIQGIGAAQSVTNAQQALPNLNNAIVYTWRGYGEAFYNIRNNLTLTAMYGFERSRANNQTELNTFNTNEAINPPTLQPLNQYATSYGWGFDYAISGSMGLFIRQRFFNMYDKSFPDEVFRGWDLTAEIKITFW